MFGQATETLQGGAHNEPRPQVYRNIFQAYGTYVVPLGSGLTVDLGKWASALGYENNYTKDQLNYSRSFYFDLPRDQSLQGRYLSAQPEKDSDNGAPGGIRTPDPLLRSPATDFTKSCRSRRQQREISKLQQIGANYLLLPSSPFV